MTTGLLAAIAPSRKNRARAEPTSGWRKLVRVTWLCHRGAIVSLLIALVALVVPSVVETIRAQSSYASFVDNGCVGHPSTVACNADALMLGGSADFHAIGIVLSLLPLLVGVFIGAPLVARELESGTFRFTWTQGAGRTRTLLISITTLGLLSVGSAVILGLIFGGSYAHLYEVVIAADVSQWQATTFTTTWWMLATWTALALGVGTLLGAVIKRTVAAMAATLAGVGGLIAAAHLLLADMLHLGAVNRRNSTQALFNGAINAPSSQLGPVTPAGSWDVRSWLTGPDGAILNAQKSQQVSIRYEQSLKHSESWQGWLTRHHLSSWVSYQPAAHFWIIQGVEGVIVLGLGALCVMAAVRRIRERVAG